MQKFVDNWSAPVVLALGATSLAVTLPDGSYAITLSDALGLDATRWEIVAAEVAAGTATLLRGQEGTDDQDWPNGSVAYLATTAAFLERIQQPAPSGYVEVSAPGVTAIAAGTAVIELFALGDPPTGQDFILDLPAPSFGTAHVYDVISWVAGSGNRLIFRSGVSGIDWGGFVGAEPVGVEFASSELRVPLGDSFALRAMFVGSASASERYLNVALVSTAAAG